MSELRAALLETLRATATHGLNIGSSGNVSVRTERGFLVTPTGMTAALATPADMVAMRLDGHHSGPRQPSSEWRFHRDIYAARPDVGAIIHTHAPFATSLACAGLEIPPFHYMIARFGGDTVRCAKYATFGTQELSDHMLAALADRSACLMANHGMTVCARDLEQALAHALELEALSEQYWRVLQIGKPVLLPADEMARVIEKFKGYGQQT